MVDRNEVEHDRLSSDGIRRLLEDNDTEQKLQVLRINQQEQQNHSVYLVELSDGYSKTTTYFISAAAKAINDGRVIKTSIVKLLETRIDSSAKGSVKVDVLRVETIQRDHKGIVGKPIDYALYSSLKFKNPNGSNDLNIVEKELHEFVETSPMGRLCTNLGFAFVMGLCAAYFLKRIVKLTAFSLGGVALFLKFLEYHGLIIINYKNWVPGISLGSITRFITFGSAGFAAGFYFGIRKDLHHLF